MSGLYHQTVEAKLRLLVERLQTVPFLRPKEVWVFGSYAKGKERPNDVDVLVVLDSDLIAWQAYMQIEERRNPPQSSKEEDQMAWDFQAKKIMRRGGGLHRVDIRFTERRLEATSLKARHFVLVWSKNQAGAKGVKVALSPVKSARRTARVMQP